MQGRQGGHRPGSGAGGHSQRGDGVAADAAAWGVQCGSPSACSARFSSPCPTSSSEEFARAKEAQARCQSAHPLETEKRYGDSTAFESEIWESCRCEERSAEVAEYEKCANAAPRQISARMPKRRSKL